MKSLTLFALALTLSAIARADDGGGPTTSFSCVNADETVKFQTTLSEHGATSYRFSVGDEVLEQTNVQGLPNYTISLRENAQSSGVDSDGLPRLTFQTRLSVGIPNLVPMAKRITTKFKATDAFASFDLGGEGSIGFDSAKLQGVRGVVQYVGTKKVGDFVKVGCSREAKALHFLKFRISAEHLKALSPATHADKTDPTDNRGYENPISEIRLNCTEEFSETYYCG